MKYKNSIILNFSLGKPKTIIEIPTKAYVDSLSENKRHRRELSHLSTLFKDHGNEFDNDKLTISESTTINRNQTKDNEVSNKNHVDDVLGESTILREFLKN